MDAPRAGANRQLSLHAAAQPDASGAPAPPGTAYGRVDGPPAIAQLSYRRNPADRTSAAGSDESRIPVLELVFDERHELVAHRSVNDAVIEGQGEIAHQPDPDRIVDDDRAFLDAADAED